MPTITRHIKTNKPFIDMKRINTKEPGRECPDYIHSLPKKLADLLHQKTAAHIVVQKIIFLLLRFHLDIAFGCKYDRKNSSDLFGKFNTDDVKFLLNAFRNSSKRSIEKIFLCISTRTAKNNPDILVLLAFLTGALLLS